MRGFLAVLVAVLVAIGLGIAGLAAAGSTTTGGPPGHHGSRTAEDVAVTASRGPWQPSPKPQADSPERFALVGRSR